MDKKINDLFAEFIQGLSKEMIIYDAEIAKPLEYSDDTLVESLFIFQHVEFNKIWEKQELEDMPIDKRCELVKEFGEKLRELIVEHTGKDPHKILDK